jgi:long-chain acyl-CoA synthetase
LESHPPSAIITHARFLPHILELIYDAHESEHHTIIVVGDFDPNTVGKAGNVIKVVKWTDVESAGTNGEKIISAAPSQFFLPLRSCN